jgi:hypothetical protein
MSEEVEIEEGRAFPTVGLPSFLHSNYSDIHYGKLSNFLSTVPGTGNLPDCFHFFQPGLKNGPVLSTSMTKHTIPSRLDGLCTPSGNAIDDHFVPMDCNKLNNVLFSSSVQCFTTSRRVPKQSSPSSSKRRPFNRLEKVSAHFRVAL